MFIWDIRTELAIVLNSIAYFTIYMLTYRYILTSKLYADKITYDYEMSR